MERSKNLLVLYQLLRAEIAQVDGQNYQVLGFAVGAAVALVTAGMALHEPLERSVVFALVVLVTWPCQLLLNGKRRLVWRIASYLRVVIEPQLDGIDWETHLTHLPRRGRYTQMLSTRAAYNEWLIITVLNAAAGLCVIAFGIVPAHIATLPKALLTALAVIGWAALTLNMKAADNRLARGHGYGVNAMYEKAWQDIAIAVSPPVSETAQETPTSSL